MHVKILGTRGEVEESAPRHTKHSGVLVDNILFDIGEKEFLDYKPKAIFLTHLHPDHAYFLREKEAPELKGLKIYAPEQWKEMKDTFVKVKKAQPIEIDGYRITPIPTIHSKKVKSTAYLIEKDGIRILYTADMIWIRKKYHNLLKDLDLVITDGSFNRKGGMIRRDKETGEIYGHQGIPNLVEFFKKLNAKRIIFTHFGSWFLKDPEKGKEEIRKYSNDMKVEAAYDGKELELEEKNMLGTTTTQEVEPVTKDVVAKLQPKAGLYLVPPHAQMIAEGTKTLIIKSKKFTAHIGEPLYLIEDSLCYGIITLKEPYEIDYDTFVRLRGRHQVSDKEAFERWGWDKKAPLYAYEFSIDAIFDEPVPVKIPRGVQVFVDAKNIKFKEIKTLTMLELLDLSETCSDEMFVVVYPEMVQRGLASETELLIKEATKDWVEQYIKHLKKYTRAQIGDDWRICVTPDTPVIANPGIEYISEIKPSREVKEVLNRTIDEEIIVVKPRYLLPVKFTREHPILTLPLVHSRANGKVVPKYTTTKLRDVRGRFVWSVEREAPTWKMASELQYFDGVQIPKLPEKPTPYPEELFALAGWYLAEGFVSREPDKALRFSLHRDEIASAFEILTLCRKLTGKWNVGSIHIDNGQGIRVDFSDEELTTFLVTQFGKGAKRKTIPRWVLEAEREKVWYLLDAYYRGDGWSSKSYMKARTVSKKLAIGLWLLWTKFGRIASLQEIRQVTNYGASVSYEISLSEHKKDAYYEDNDSFWLPIEKVWKEHYSGMVWNLETSSNTYQVPFTVHNCLGWYSSLKRGKKLYKHTKDGDIPITEDDCKKLAVAIVKELIARGATFNRPETYKKYARELFEYVIREIGEKNIPWKDEEKKAKLDPEKVTRADLEQIDDVYVKTLSDEQLKKLHDRLHQLEKEIGKVTEPLENAHIFVWNEMKHRNIQHPWLGDELDRRSALEVVEYPQPEIGEPQEILKDEDFISLEEALKAFPKEIVVSDPIHVYLCGRIVNEGKIPTSHDIDLLFKQGWYHVPTIHAFLDAVSANNPEVARRFHFVWDAKGPHIGYTVPLYRLAFVQVSPEEMKRTSPFEFLAGEKAEIFKPYIGLKPKSGFEKNEFWDVKEMWEKWAKHYIDRGIMIQKKYDGMRFQIHCKGNQVKIITEDRQRDRASVFKKSVEELLKNKKADSFILDAEMVEYNCGGKKVNDIEYCEPIAREEMIKWIGAERKELDDEYIIFHVHDCTYLNGEAINDKGYLERWKAIDEVFPQGLRHWKKVGGEIAYDMKTFFRLVKKYRSLPGSEGVVAKAIDSRYPIKYSGENRTAEWAKLKNLKEIDVMVWKVVQKKTKEGKPLPQYLYDCIFAIPCSDVGKYREKDVVKIGNKCYLYIGRTYATAEKVKPGDIIVVRPIRVAEFKDPKGKLYYSIAPDRVIPIKTEKGIKLLTVEELFESIESPVELIGPNEAKSVSGLETITWNGKEFRWSPILGISRHPTNGELIKLVQRGCEIEVTPGHSVIDKEGNVVDVETNPEIKVCRSIPRIGEKEKLEISLPGYKREGDKLYLKPSGIPFTDNNFSWSPRFVYAVYEGERLKALMRFLGAYAAEGSASKNQTSYRVRISNNNREWLESLISDIMLISDAKPNWEMIRSSKTWNLVLWSRPLYDLVTSLVGKGAKNKTFPEEIFMLKREFQEEFLKTLSQGDGTYGKGLTSASRKLLSGLSLLYAMNGKNFSIRPNHSCLRIDPVRYWRKACTKRYIFRRKFSGYTYDIQTSDGNFVDGAGLGLCKNTWMFPYYDGKHPAKKEPDSIDVVKKLVAIGTGPPKEQLATEIINLPLCPYWLDSTICPLKDRFRIPRYMLSKVLVEYLKYPIVCKFANHYRCRFVKSYYYGYKEYEVKSELDEDTGEEINENKS